MTKRTKTDPLVSLEQNLGYRFKDRALLDAALTHRSFRFEHDGVIVDNQRLEFLGDAILDAVLASFMYREFPDWTEGTLTAARSRIASGRALANFARAIDLGDYLRMGKGTEQSGGRRQESILADAFEAVLGAAFLDRGLKAVEKIFDTLLLADCRGLSAEMSKHNPKGCLQELSQREWKTGPEYRLVSSVGPPHAMLFTVTVRLPDGTETTAEAPSKQQAETLAALRAIETIGGDRR